MSEGLRSSGWFEGLGQGGYRDFRVQKGLEPWSKIMEHVKKKHVERSHNHAKYRHCNPNIGLPTDGL